MQKSGFFVIALLLLGCLCGFLNGLLGAGGGIPLVVGMQCLFGNKVPNGKRFYVTTLAVMLPLSLFSAYRYAQKGAFPFSLFYKLILPAVLGGALGAFLLRVVPIRILGRIFATVVLLSGILMVI